MVERVFLDMDGVLADWFQFVLDRLKITGINSVHAHALDWYGRREFLAPYMDRIDHLMAQEKESFWRHLPKTGFADDLVELVCSTFIDVGILTKCPLEHCGAYDGKRDWLRMNFPGFERMMVTARDKGKVAAPGHLLLDDDPRQVESFKRHNGAAIQVPAGLSDEQVMDAIRMQVQALA